MSCPRNFTKEELIAGLKAGKVLVQDRVDAPELEDLLELEKEGLVTKEYFVIDSQHAVIKWRWRNQ